MIASIENYDCKRQYRALLSHHRLKENDIKIISQKADIPYDTVKNWSRKEASAPEPIHMLKLGKAFDISPEFFFTNLSVDAYNRVKTTAANLKANFDENLTKNDQITLCKFIIGSGVYIGAASRSSGNLSDKERRQKAIEQFESEARILAGYLDENGSSSK